MNRNLVHLLDMPRVEITPEIVVEKMAEGRRLHDEAIVAFVKAGIARINHALSGISRIFVHDRVLPRSG